MAPRRPKGEKTRQQILEAAKQQILSKGFTATSMRDIAQASGISPAAIYNHFKNKDELFDAVIDENFPGDQILADLQRVKTDDPRVYLRATVRSIVETLLSREDYIRLGLIDAQERQGRSIRSLLPRMFPVFFGAYLEVKARDGGRVLRDIPPEAVMRTLVSLVFGFVFTEYVARPTETLSLPTIDWVGAMVEIMMHGIAKPPEA